MTLQEAFDKIWDWFVVQGRTKSIAPGDVNCKYRYGDLRCAVGVLIPDELYDPAYENNGIHELLDTRGWAGLDAEKKATRLYKELAHLQKPLGDLQRIHDNGPEGPQSFSLYMKRQLHVFAGEYCLTVPE